VSFLGSTLEDPSAGYPPVDASNRIEARAYILRVLLYGPGRLDTALRSLQVHRDTKDDSERDLARRRSMLLLELSKELASTGAKTNAEQREALLDERVSRDVESATLRERLTNLAVLLANASIEVAFEENRLKAARAAALLLGGE